MARQDDPHGSPGSGDRDRREDGAPEHREDAATSAPGPGEGLDAARPGPPTLGTWIDLHALLRRDEAEPLSALHRRDRAIGAAGALRSDAPERRLVAWVRGMRMRESRTAGGEPLRGERVAELVRRTVALLTLSGLVFGALAAFGAFAYQPLGRINVVAVLGGLIGVQWILLALAILGAVPRSVRRMVPLLGAESEGGGWLQPARLALRAVPARERAILEEALGQGRTWERRSGTLARWLLVSSSQGAAIAFNLGAIGMALLLVVFTDLSFGWSTTLAVDASTALAITDALSLPWRGVWPEAVPGLSLVETTRYFRIAATPAEGVAPATYGAWWPFIVMTIAVYGLGPRLAFWSFARLRYRRALARALVELPGSRRILERMEAPVIETRAETISDADGRPAAGGSVAQGRLPARAILLDWADAASGAADPLPFEAEERFAAGGRRPPREDERAVEAVARLARERDLPIVVAVRGFEPPLLELVDLLGQLRAALGDGREILVAPIGGGKGEHGAWQRRLGSLGDPWLQWAGPAAPASRA